MKEKSYYAKIGHFYVIRARQLKRTIVWEAKLSKKDSMPFSTLLPHQEEKMLESERSLNFKIPDVGKQKKPADGIAVYDAYPVIVAIFYAPRATQIFEITLRAWIVERESYDRKSLTIDRAGTIGKLIKL